jgi:hypothetical protein
MRCTGFLRATAHIAPQSEKRSRIAAIPPTHRFDSQSRVKVALKSLCALGFVTRYGPLILCAQCGNPHDHATFGLFQTSRDGLRPEQSARARAEREGEGLMAHVERGADDHRHARA